MSDEGTGATTEAARRLLPGSAATSGLDRLAALAARLLHIPSSTISLITDVAVAVGSAGRPPALAATTPIEDSLCARTAQQGRALALADTYADVELRQLPAVGNGIVATFLGVPILADSGHAVGAICVYGPEPRTWSPDDVAILHELAMATIAELELAALARDFEASRARWDLAIAAAGAGTFDWDLVTGRLLWDQRLIELFGYDDGTPFHESIEDFNARVHPDDRPHVGRALQFAIDTVGEYEAEYRVVRPDGRVLLLQARGRAIGVDGRSRRVLGAAWDVTTTRSAEARAGEILEAMPVGYLAITGDGRITAVNRLAEQLFGATQASLYGMSVTDLIPAQWWDAAVDRIADSDRVETFEFPIVSSERWCEVRLGAEGFGHALYVTDVTERRAARDAIQLAADRDRTVATALQTALLPTLPSRPDLQIVARYRAAAAGDMVGGDWYDAVFQPDGSLLVTVGDVAGHDIKAAAVMGHLRGMSRVFAWQGNASPAQVLSELDRAMHDLEPDALATAIVVRVESSPDDSPRRDPALHWCSAGHPPPILVHADGSVEVLDGANGIMLGVLVGSDRVVHDVSAERGATMLLFTDGLIESRYSDLDTGLDRVCQALRGHGGADPDTLLDLAVGTVLRDQSEDDIVLLAVHFTA